MSLMKKLKAISNPLKYGLLATALAIQPLNGQDLLKPQETQKKLEVLLEENSSFQETYKEVMENRKAYFDEIYTAEELKNIVIKYAFFQDLQDKPYIQRLFSQDHVYNLVKFNSDVLDFDTGIYYSPLTPEGYIDYSKNFPNKYESVFRPQIIDFILNEKQHGFSYLSFEDSLEIYVSKIGNWIGFQTLFESPENLKKLAELENNQEALDIIYQIDPRLINQRRIVTNEFFEQIKDLSLNFESQEILKDSNFVNFLDEALGQKRTETFSYYNFGELERKISFKPIDLLIKTGKLIEDPSIKKDLIEVSQKYGISTLEEFLILANFQGDSLDLGSEYKLIVPSIKELLEDQNFQSIYDYLEKNTTDKYVSGLRFLSDALEINESINNSITSFKGTREIVENCLKNYNEIISIDFLKEIIKDKSLEKLLFQESTKKGIQKQKEEGTFFSFEYFLKSQISFLKENPSFLEEKKSTILKSDAILADFLKMNNQENQIKYIEKNREEFIGKIRDYLGNKDHVSPEFATRNYRSENLEEITQNLQIIQKNGNSQEISSISPREYFDKKNYSSLSQLNSMDLLKITQILTSLNEKEFLQEIASQMQEDIYNPFTEYTGLLMYGSDGSVRLLQQRASIEDSLLTNNTKGNFTYDSNSFIEYFTGKDTIRYIPITSFHNHAGDFNERENSCGSKEDFKSAQKTGLDGVIAFPLGKGEEDLEGFNQVKRFGILYYTSDGISISLGVYDPFKEEKKDY
jgi:hypothetical protein